MKNSTIISGWRFRLVQKAIMLNLLWIAIRRYRHPVKIVQQIRKLIEHRDQVFGSMKRHKYARIDGKYYLSFGIPRWPSAAFNRYVDTHMRKLEKEELPLLNTLIFAITKKCGFECEHCFEWYNLNKKETLTRENVIEIIHRFYALGVTMVQFSGGEPLNRFRDILEIMQQVPKDMECWIYTNGFSLTEEKAILLKQSGITGMAISLDHHIEAKHDAFRGVAGSYKKVMEAAEICNRTGLAVTFSVCATHALANEMDMLKIASLANEKNVRFIQVLEPKAVGHYAGKDVSLRPEQLEELDKFFLDINYNPLFLQYPIVLYHGYYNRRSGCLGGAKNFVYVDTDGNVHSCPFCQHPLYSALDRDLQQNIAIHKKVGCNVYESHFKKITLQETNDSLLQMQN